MRKIMFFIMLSLGLLLFLSCARTLMDSLDLVTMDPTERKAYKSFSDEQQDKYLKMNQDERDRYRVENDRDVIEEDEDLDSLKQSLITARAYLNDASASEGDVLYCTGDSAGWIWYGESLEGIDHDSRCKYVASRGPKSKSLHEEWQSCMENVRELQVAVHDSEQKLESLKQQKLKSYAESRTAWEAKNKQMSGPVSGGCFTSDTLVLMESGYKRIADIKAGDRVLSVDSKGNRAVNEVVRHYILTNNHYYIINGKIKVTARHLFYTSGGDKRVQDLQTGDRIRMSDGTFEAIVSKERIAGDLTVYNLDVAENDNFFVSSDGSRGYLVHNCGAK